MKKEFYKLFLVFAMIVFSFSLAFFLGREITLSDQGIQNEKKQALQKNPLESSNLSSAKQKTYLKSPARLGEGVATSQGQVTPQGQVDEAEAKKHASQKEASSLPKGLSSASSQAGSTPPNQLTKRSQTKLTLSENQKTTASPGQNDLKKNKTPPLFALMVNSYKSKELAVESSAKLKLRFPEWRWFLKKSKKSYKVYIGPFEQKNLAEQFLKQLRKNKEFASVKLEKI